MRRDKETDAVTQVQMKCKQRDACDARTKSYTDGRVCRDQGNHLECITCGYGNVGQDYQCTGKLPNLT